MSSETRYQDTACCKLPPACQDYRPMGGYEIINGYKTYICGPEQGDKAIIMVYDAFGYSRQILQGADLLASQGHRVFMPDFLKGDYATPDMFADTYEAVEKKSEWFSRFPSVMDMQSRPVGEWINLLKKQYRFQKMAAVGFCWGYKAVITSEGTKSVFDAIIGAHPSFASESDGDQIKAPLFLLASSGEDMGVMGRILEAVEVKNPGKNKLKHYPDSPHGWCAARGEMSSESGRNQFYAAYTDMCEFLKRYV